MTTLKNVITAMVAGLAIIFGGFAFAATASAHPGCADGSGGTNITNSAGEIKGCFNGSRSSVQGEVRDAGGPGAVLATGGKNSKSSTPADSGVPVTSGGANGYVKTSPKAVPGTCSASVLGQYNGDLWDTSSWGFGGSGLSTYDPGCP